ncbi:MAG: hypothetical protein AAF823_08155 [Planctomycetota bacterium]
MVATLTHDRTETHGVLARLSDGGPEEMDTRAVLGVVRGAMAGASGRSADGAWSGPSGLTSGGAGLSHRPLGTSPAARVMERYLGRLSDRLASLNEAIERADLAAADELLAEVARSSRQHGCRTICRAAETARDEAEAVHADASAEAARLRTAIEELSELADEVASAARRLDALPGLPPRA